MQVTLRVVLSTFILSILALTAVSEANASGVALRVEGTTGTLFEGKVINTEQPCQGASQANAISVLASAASKQGFSWHGSWSAGMSDFLVTKIAGLEQDSDEGHYWGLLLRHRAAEAGAFSPLQFSSTGGCHALVNDGDEVLWAYDPWAAKHILQLSGPVEVAKDSPITMTVVDARDNTPIADASIRSGEVQVDGRTSGQGVATISFSETGIHRLKATATDSIRSNRVDVCVSETGHDGCTE